MVIYCDDKFYHGHEASKFMVKYGDKKGVFNIFNSVLFRTDCISRLLYPPRREIRHLLLKIKSVRKIDNLNCKSEPIFKSIFGESWDDLLPVIQKHYANRPYTEDVITVNGKLDLMCEGPIKILSPFFSRY